MSLFSDLGSFLNDVQSINNEIDVVKQDVVSGLKDAIFNVESQGKDVVTELQASTDGIAQASRDIQQDVQSQFNK